MDDCLLIVLLVKEMTNCDQPVGKKHYVSDLVLDYLISTAASWLIIVLLMIIAVVCIYVYLHTNFNSIQDGWPDSPAGVPCRITKDKEYEKIDILNITVPRRVPYPNRIIASCA